MSQHILVNDTAYLLYARYLFSQRKFKMCSTVYKSNEIVQENVPMVLKHRGQKKGFLTFLCLLLSQSRQILGKHSESFPQLRQETLPIMSILITHIGYISQPSIHNTTIYKKNKIKYIVGSLIFPTISKMMIISISSSMSLSNFRFLLNHQESRL